MFKLTRSCLASQNLWNSSLGTRWIRGKPRSCPPETSGSQTGQRTREEPREHFSDSSRLPETPGPAELTPPKLQSLLDQAEQEQSEMAVLGTPDAVDPLKPIPWWNTDPAIKEHLTKRGAQLVAKDRKDMVKIRVDPKETSVILFPGQGSQFVGMGTNCMHIDSVRRMFDTADQILGYSLADMCLNGPKESLDKTVHCQPATFVTSLAAIEKLRIERPGIVEKCVITAGFSVGEFAALVLAQAMTFEDALRLVKLRAEEMQKCSEQVPSGLMTVFYGAGGRPEFACRMAAEFVARKGTPDHEAVCSVANNLFPHCLVIGGHEEALQFIENNKADFGLKRTKRLTVSGAFHTKLMEPAREVLREALNRTPINRPAIKVYSNVTGLYYRDEKEIRKNLAKQLVSTVKWETILHNIYDRDRGEDYPWTFECGPGDTCVTTLKFVNLKARKSAARITI